MSTTDVLCRARVLLVDDHEDTRDMFTVVLRACGADVIVAGTVDEALGLLANRDVDVVVSGDVQPPGSDHSLVEHARQRGALAVALTGRCMPAEVEATRDAGFEIILLKPIDPDDLCGAVADALRRRRAA